MNLGEKARAIIGKIAPTVGAALGGPFGALAGNILGGLLGGDERAIEQAVLSGNPDALAKVRIAEIELQKRLEELGVRDLELSNEDRASARSRQERLRDVTPAVLAGAITVGFFGVLGYMLVEGVPANAEALYIMLGSLGTAWASVVAYFFGSSAGSKDKTAELARALRK